MAQTIVIPEGDKDLKDVTKITPDTKVNLRSNVKYPTDVYGGPKQNSMISSSWTEDDVVFTNPDIVNKSEDESGIPVES